MNVNVDDTSWIASKACVSTDVDPEAFFASTGTLEGAEAVAEAKATCARCLVRSNCLEYALTNKIEFGIWGGMDEHERAALLRREQFPNRPNAPTWDERCGTYAGTKAHRDRAEQFCEECREARNTYERERKRAKAAARNEEMSA